jgi:hypothetical protein
MNFSGVQILAWLHGFKKLNCLSKFVKSSNSHGRANLFLIYFNILAKVYQVFSEST